MSPNFLRRWNDEGADWGFAGGGPLRTPLVLCRLGQKKTISFRRVEKAKELADAHDLLTPRLLEEIGVGPQ